MHTEDTRAPGLLPGEKFFYPSHKGITRREIGRIRAAREMLSAVKRYHPDLIYLRYGMYVFPIHRLMSIAPVVEEINTNDLEQHKELGFVYASYNRLTWAKWNHFPLPITRLQESFLLGLPDIAGMESIN
ncbi:MAG: hypothetical protein B5M51_06140 [Anaerolinea sp. 4484_236]|nr:MAG: hypothetical protein B5M51_06140 [Anaerolinea sp. 4484_236]